MHPSDIPNRARRSFLQHLDLDRAGGTVDLGCGDEGLALTVAGLLPGGTLTLLTHNETARASLEARLRPASAAHVTVVAAAAGSLPPARFDLAYMIVPPYLSKARLDELLAGARRCLRPGGRFVLLAGKRQGADSILRRAEEIFGNLEILDKPGGMRIACCRADSVEDTSDSEIAASLEEPFSVSLRGHDFSFLTAADVFSRGVVDDGTRLLLETVDVPPAARLADLGCGYGVIGIVAARLTPAGRATLVDASPRAVDLSLRNIERNGIANAEVLVSDGLSAVPGRTFDLVLSNPPLHAAPGTLERLTAEACEQLIPGGRLIYVVHRAYDARPAVRSVFGDIETLAETDAYRLISAVRRTPVGRGASLRGNRADLRG